MRTIHYSIRLVVMLALISLAYLSIVALFHQVVQLSILLTLLVITPGIERLWVLLEWMGPVIGTVNMKERERTQKRIIEHQLSRSQRYGSRLVIAAIREKKRTSLHVVEKNLRDTDIVLRDSSGYLLALMPDTTIEQADSALKRLMSLIPVKSVAVMDESMLHAAVSKRSEGANHSARSVSPGNLREICTQMLDEKLASLPMNENETGTPVVYSLFEPVTQEKQSELCDDSARDESQRLLRNPKAPEGSVRAANP